MDYNTYDAKEQLLDKESPERNGTAQKVHISNTKLKKPNLNSSLIILSV